MKQGPGRVHPIRPEYLIGDKSGKEKREFYRGGKKIGGHVPVKFVRLSSGRSPTSLTGFRVVTMKRGGLRLFRYFVIFIYYRIKVNN